MRKNLDLGLLIIRLSVGFLMLLHGIGKLNGGLTFIQNMVVEKGLPGFIAYGAIIGEILAPLAIIIGFRSRLAALVFAFNCLVAILLVHSGDIFTLGKTGGWAIELLGLYLFTSIAIFFTGAGKYAVSHQHNWD
ncbi:DoxX family protein [Membranihabitans marinus]|uniref:DoxX family protein n=1 Tax=Membranihabitans marinus TaxID=1227546 RepID=UPI001F418B70|nr:DoxX family protein [Membranihabitans marinus]